MDNYSVKENISKIRKAAGISQAEMADKLGISRTAYRNLEKGETKLISESLDKIAALFQTTTEHLALGYQPTEAESERVKDMELEYSDKKKKLAEKYEDEISSLKSQINTLEKYVEALKDNISTKDEIISMLKKKLGENGTIE